VSWISSGLWQNGNALQSLPIRYQLCNSSALCEVRCRAFAAIPAGIS
jgi:hypothetical protein